MKTPLLAACLVFALGASAQPADEGEPLPSLDELLGLGSEDETDAPSDGVDAELESELDQAGKISDAFLEAVGLMNVTAERLASTSDTGVVTQRLQEDILKHLEQLIKDAGKQGQSSSSSSSGSQQEQQSQQQPNQGQQQQDSQQAQSGEPSDSSDGPAGQAAQPGDSTLNTAAWGALPQRLRDALLQGSADGYSSLYRSLTEDYYRRLAEEASE